MGRSTRSAQQPRRRSVRAVGACVATLLGAVLVPSTATAGAAPTAPSLTATPTSGLVDAESVAVQLAGLAPGSDWAIVECGLAALSFYTTGARPAQDGCEQRDTALVEIPVGGARSASFTLRAELTTAAGPVNCIASACFLAAEEMTSIDGSGLKLVSLHFASAACAARGSCALAPDAWSPLAGKGAPVLAKAQPTTVVAPFRAATTAKPFTEAPVPIELAPDLASTTALTGFGSSPGVTGPVVNSGSGIGLVELTMVAPGTSWGTDAVVATVSVKDLTTKVALPALQVVLHEGATPFTYAEFVGTLHASDHYQVTVTPSPATGSGLSVLPSGQAPKLGVRAAQLLLVTASNPLALAETFAPVLYGRSTSAMHDTPLLLDATSQPVTSPPGGTRLSYTIVFSHEDAGTAFLPSLEWSQWGRLTDIEGAFDVTVDASGKPVAADYFSGGVPTEGYPDSDGALAEHTEAFPLAGASWWGTHPLLRVATGNNDFSAVGTTPFRFQLAVVAGPQPGATRESIMGSYPFTSVAMAHELASWYLATSTDPRSVLEGTATQYAPVEVTASGTGVTGTTAEVELGGQWYASNEGITYLNSGLGHFQTVVKLPLGWTATQVQAIRLGVYPASAASSVTVSHLEIDRVDLSGNRSVVRASTPGQVIGLPPTSG